MSGRGQARVSPSQRPLSRDGASDKLLKVLALERARHFDDGAVSGGLDRFLRNAIAGAKLGQPLLQAIAALPKSGYASLSQRQRSEWNKQVHVLLNPGRSGPTPPVKRARGATTKPTPARPAPTSNVDAPVGSLGRVRGTTVRRLQRLGVETVEDLLWYFPRRHVDFTKMKPIAELVVGEEATIVGTIQRSRIAFMGKRMRATEATIADTSGKIRAVWFNQTYLAKQLQQGERIGLAGRVSAYRKRLQLDNPEWELLSDDPAEDGTHVGRLVPIYGLTQGLSGRTVRKLARVAVERALPLVSESLPPEVLEETQYPPLQQAIRELHFPETLGERDIARERLAFEELLAIQLAVLQRKRAARARRDAPPIELTGEFVQRFIDALPFQLTRAQMRTLTEIRADVARTEPMARLLQGDVGAGKTVIAAAAVLGAIAAGYQGAVMAPTEILAEQHYRTFQRLFGGERTGSVFHDYTVVPALGRPVRMALLTGSVGAARKREVQRALGAGELDLVIGTHALIQRKVGMDRLGLAVVDEQHRFGVLQRDALRSKGRSPHLLVMTATPIPRTLALTIYGDLDASRLDELPPGRQPVETRYVEPSGTAAVYARVREEIAAGHQVFVICPLIEESELVETKAAVQEFERLRTTVFPDLAPRMRLLHGRMSGSEKEAVMADLLAKRADILVSTSVVEVGVDVPDATVVVIEGAERFGLSQLHQMRGRVGRSAHQSYCYLLSDSKGDGTRRLTLMEQTTDGFKLAEADLEMRGPGEYFGTRQSGLPDLRVAKLTDRVLLFSARNYAERILERDPHLRAPEHRVLAARAGQLHVEGAQAVH